MSINWLGCVLVISFYVAKVFAESKNELLTKKLPMFLSRLNEISGGCEKILSVSESFWSNLKFLRIID